MFTQDTLEKAIRIQQLGYKMLMWFADEVDQHRISLAAIHDNTSPREAILDWLKTFYDYMPSYLLPRRAELTEFSNYFASYLTSSFDLKEEPGMQLAGQGGCFCNLCIRLTNASHLKAKKPQKLDKREAMDKRIAIIGALAQEISSPISHKTAEALANSSQYLRDVAYLAYAKSLLERISGSEGGVYALVLWRQFAWKPEGSPIRGFELSAADILAAEEKVKAAIFQSE